MEGPSTRLRLRVSPGAAGSCVVGRHGEAWKLRVAAPPEGGKANDAALDLLAGVLRVPRGRIELVSGRTARDKVVALRGLSADEADERLAEAAGEGRA